MKFLTLDYYKNLDFKEMGIGIDDVTQTKFYLWTFKQTNLGNFYANYVK